MIKGFLKIVGISIKMTNKDVQNILNCKTKDQYDIVLMKILTRESRGIIKDKTDISNRGINNCILINGQLILGNSIVTDGEMIDCTCDIDLMCAIRDEIKRDLVCLGLGKYGEPNLMLFTIRDDYNKEWNGKKQSNISVTLH